MRAVPTTLPVFAAITAVPAARAVTRPALLTDAIASFDDDHMKSRFGTTMPLELCALATSCTRSPTASVSSGGVTMTACTDGTSVGRDRPLGLARRCACRAASSSNAARHRFDLLKPLAAEKLENTPHARPTATIWPELSYADGSDAAATAPSTLRLAQTMSSVGPAVLSVQEKASSCS